MEGIETAFGVEYVTGDLSNPSARPGTTEARVGLRPVNKIIQGDWPWHANRPVDNDKYYLLSLWHNYKGRRYENILFGDGHVENYHFPPEMVNWIDKEPDMKFKWW